MNCSNFLRGAGAKFLSAQEPSHQLLLLLHVHTSDELTEARQEDKRQSKWPSEQPTVHGKVGYKNKTARILHGLVWANATCAMLDAERIMQYINTEQYSRSWHHLFDRSLYRLDSLKKGCCCCCRAMLDHRCCDQSCFESCCSLFVHWLEQLQAS